MRARHGLQLGRHLYEIFDFWFLRSPFWDPITSQWHVDHLSMPAHSDRVAPNQSTVPVKLWVEQDARGVVNRSYQVDRPRVQSVCDKGPRYAACPPAASEPPKAKLNQIMELNELVKACAAHGRAYH